MKAKMLGLLMVVALISLSGCATNRGIVSLSVPEVTPGVPQTGQTVCIHSVTDMRVFESNPKTQDIPSLGFGGSDQVSDDLKKRAIARKRNTYGKALGDILLQEGQTVETVMTDAISKAFAEKGYLVLDSCVASEKTTVMVTAEITKFWAYMTPGFWALTLSSDIATELEFRSMSTQSERVEVHAEGNYQIASEGNWMEIIKQSVTKYVDELKTRIK